MFGSMGQTNVKNLGNGGTIDGDLVVTGDLQVSGGGSLSFDEIIEGTSQVKVTSTSAFLVEKADGTDVFKVDTTNSKVIALELDISGNVDIDGTTNLDVVDIDGAVDMASTLTVNSNTTITTADNTDTLTLISTDADSNSGPNLRLYRNSSSPADSDVFGQIDFEGRNDNSQDFVGAMIKVTTGDVSDGSEDAQIEFDVMTAGTLREYMRMASGSTPAVIFNQDSQDIDFRVLSDNLDPAFFVQGSDGHVGIGTASPSDYLADADNLVVASSGNTGITIASTGTDQICKLVFADGTSGTAEYIGQVAYNHNGNTMTLGTNGADRLTINSTGSTTIYGRQFIEGTDAFLQFHDTGETASAGAGVHTIISADDVLKFMGREDDASAHVEGFDLLRTGVVHFRQNVGFRHKQY